MIGLLASSGGVNLLPDITFFPQLAIFLAVLGILSRFVLKPSLAILNRRTELTSEAAERADHLDAEAEKMQHEIDDRLHRERQQMLQETDKQRALLQEESKQRLHALRQKTNKEREKQRASLAQYEQTIEQTLTQEMSQYSDLILKKLTYTSDGRSE